MTVSDQDGNVFPQDPTGLVTAMLNEHAAAMAAALEVQRAAVVEQEKQTKIMMVAEQEAVKREFAREHMTHIVLGPDMEYRPGGMTPPNWIRVPNFRGTAPSVETQVALFDRSSTAVGKGEKTLAEHETYVWDILNGRGQAQFDPDYVRSKLVQRQYGTEVDKKPSPVHMFFLVLITVMSCLVLLVPVLLVLTGAVR